MVKKVLAAGLIVHVQGIPVELTQETTVNTTEENFALITRMMAEEANHAVITGAEACMSCGRTADQHDLSLMGRRRKRCK